MTMPLDVATRRPAFAIAVNGMLAVAVLLSSVLWDATHLPQSPLLGRDFAAFYASAVAWQHDHNPYDWAQLGATEARLPSIGDPHQHMDFNSYANPPLFTWAMTAFTGLSPRGAYAVWLALMLAALLAGSAIAAQSYGTRGRGWLLLFAASPAPIIALFLGQQTPLLLLGLAAALAALRRGRPELAGVALSIGWIKPHLIFPVVVVLAALLGWRRARRLLIGFACSSALLGLASWLVTGGSLFVAWGRDLVLYAHTMDSVQPDLSSLAGLYLSVLARPWSGYLAVALLAAWALLAAVLVWRARRLGLAPADDAWLRLAGVLLATWLLVVPYTHPADLVLLAVILPVVLGRQLEGLHDPRVRLAIAMLLLAPEADLLGFRPNFVLSYSVLIPLTLVAALRPVVLLRRPSPCRDTAVSAR